MLKERIQSFRFAFKGVGSLFVSEPNARIHLIMAILVVLFAWFFEVAVWEWCMLIICIFLVFFAEAINTALEHLTDLASPDIHPLAGKAKDIAAAAVLFCAFGAATIGLIIFLPKIWALLSNLNY